MKLKIAYNDKEYTLGFTRASAKKMTQIAGKLKDNDDIVENAEVIIRASLFDKHADLPEEEAKAVVGYILDNCQLVDKEEDGKTEKGLITYLNEMLSECMPKGFTGKTEKGFKVVD